MTSIKDEKQYNTVLKRIEELMEMLTEDFPEDHIYSVELDLLAGLVSDYEEVYYPIEKPTLVDVIKLRMFEMGLNQKSLSALLDVSDSRVSEYLSGKSEPTLKVARLLHQRLNIDSDIILGV